MNAATATTATDKQLALIARLLGERHLSYPPPAPTSKRQASFVISLLMDAPRKTADTPAPAQPAAPARPGYYLIDGQVVRVQANKLGTGTYARVMVIDEFSRKGTWRYVSGLAAKLATAEPMTVEQAAALGHAHGVCMICGRELTEAGSVARGIGPVCARRLRALEPLTVQH